MVRVTAKADYGLRAMVELATIPVGERRKGSLLAATLNISPGFCENILAQLRAAQLVRSQRGSEGGYWLARPADEITVGQVLLILDGPHTEVGGRLPQALDYPGAAAALRDLWIGVSVGLERLLGSVTLADVAAGRLPPNVRSLPVSGPLAPAVKPDLTDQN